MHTILALALSVASAQTVTFDGTQLTITSQYQRQIPAEVDVLIVQLSANDPREWDAAIMTVSDGEARVRKLLEKEDPGATIRTLSQSATDSAQRRQRGASTRGEAARSGEDAAHRQQARHDSRRDLAHHDPRHHRSVEGAVGEPS